MSGFPVLKTVCEVYRGAARCSASVFLLAGIAIGAAAVAPAQKVSGGPAVVQPGAPGEPTKKLPADTHAALPPISRADVEFMQG